MAFKPSVLFADFSGGANTRDTLDNIAKNQSPYPLNIEYIGKTVRKARGFTALGTEVDATLIGKSLWNHRILSTEEVLVKTIGTKLKYYDEVNATTYPISSTSFTAGLRWWFASFNGYLYGGNGTDPFIRWRASSWGALSAPVLAAAVTIVLGTGEGARFATAGSGFIEGDTFSWTGVSVDTLTGVTGLGVGHPAGSRVTVEADTTTYSSNPRGSVGVFFRNRIYVRDDSAANFLYFSKLADNSNPQDDLANFSIAGSGTGDAGFLILPAAILGLRVFITGGNDPVLVAFCADGIAYSISVSDTGSNTVGLNVPFKVLGEDLVSKSMSVSTENDLVVLTGANTMRAIGYGDQSTTIKTARVSDVIQPTIELLDFSDGAMAYMDRKILAQGKVNDSGINNYTVVKDTDPDAFCFYDFLQVNDFAEWKNRNIALSSIDGRLLELQSSYGAAGLPIRSSYPTYAEDFGQPLLYKSAIRARITGYITSNCNLIGKVYFDQSTAPFSFLINGSNSEITALNDEVAIGTVVFGESVVGGELPEGIVRKFFTADLQFPTLDYFFFMYFVFENNEADVDFALDKILVWAEPTDSNLQKESAQLASSDT